MPRTLVKICGLNDEAAMIAAIEAGADFVGVVLFPPSPRAVGLDQAADLLSLVPEGVGRCALLVDPDDRALDRTLTHLRLDLLQLHGQESPERVEAIRQTYGLPVMKALGIASAADLDAALPFAEVADRLLLDARPPPDADRPGGHGAPFDWSLLAGRRWPRPWFLAGGLTPDNVAAAIAALNPPGVDVSSGVERAPGLKDPDLIARFIAAAHRATRRRPARASA